MDRQTVDDAIGLLLHTQDEDTIVDVAHQLFRELTAEKERSARLEKALIAAKKALESMPRSYGLDYGPLPQIYAALGDTNG